MDDDKNVQKLRDRVGSSDDFLQEDQDEMVTIQPQFTNVGSIENIGTVQVKIPLVKICIGPAIDI